jgi:hypothetical protein
MPRNGFENRNTLAVYASYENYSADAADAIGTSASWGGEILSITTKNADFGSMNSIGMANDRRNASNYRLTTLRKSARISRFYRE